MTPAELARIRDFAARLREAPAIVGEDLDGRVPGVWLRADTRVKVCEALTALADEVEASHQQILDLLKEAGQWGECWDALNQIGEIVKDWQDRP